MNVISKILGFVKVAEPAIKIIKAALHAFEVFTEDLKTEGVINETESKK